MPNQCESLIKNLALTAAEQTTLSGMSELLRKIAECFSASGCMLWQLDEVVPDEQEEEETGQDGQNEQGTYLFVQGVWFRNDKQIYQLEPLSEHIAQALNDQKNQVIDKISIADNFEVAVCVVPVFTAKHAACGINLYRDITHPFTDEEVLKISEAVEVIPTLLQTIRNRVGFQLLLGVNQLLHDAESDFSVSSLVLNAKVILNRICYLISKTFQCLETTIALEDPFESPGVYKCLATTWPEELQKPQYDETVDPGITGWVLRNNKPVRIIDLDQFEEDLELIQKKYPGINWNQKPAVVSVVSKLSGGLTEEELPPLTFMAVPIVKGDKVLGVVRCSVAQIVSKEEPTGGPFFFTEYELNLLKLVANLIGQFWMNQLRLREEKRVQIEQNYAYEDLAHQLKGPINQTLIKIQLLLELLDRTDTKASVSSSECKDLIDRISKMLAMAGGLCRKAKRVTASIGLFADLAEGNQFLRDTKRLNTDELIKMLIETAQDNKQMLFPRKNIGFQVHPTSFEVLDSLRVEVNGDLLEQAVNNLLDNAGKYSFNNTEVTISGGVIQKEWFYFSVVNVGLPIEEKEIELAVQRRWQGNHARQVIGEGSGIGLWIVDNIMKAHQGKLTILPTTSEHRTEVRLLFPLNNRW